MRFRFCLEVILRISGQKGFVILPKRWVIERTFAWLSNNRRMLKDYERYCQTSERDRVKCCGNELIAFPVFPQLFFFKLPNSAS
jgi:hypothetical protein